MSFLEHETVGRKLEKGVTDVSWILFHLLDLFAVQSVKTEWLETLIQHGWVKCSNQKLNAMLKYVIEELEWCSLAGTNPRGFQTSIRSAKPPQSISTEWQVFSSWVHNVILERNLPRAKIRGVALENVEPTFFVWFVATNEQKHPVCFGSPMTEVLQTLHAAHLHLAKLMQTCS